MTVEKGGNGKRHRAWHTLPADEVLLILDSHARHGLAPAEVEQRLLRYGPNKLEEGRRRTPWQMLLRQFADVMILVLLAAAAISALLGQVNDALVIVVIVLLNAIIGVIQEYRAEQALTALRRMTAQQARVRRGGHLDNVAASDLVPGDIVLLEAGDVVPADLRLLEVYDIAADESAISGESVTVEKSVATIDSTEIPLGDRRNMVYKATHITRGRAVGVTVATGVNTEFGRIAAMLAQAGTGLTPLQQRLARFGRILALAVLVVAAIIFVGGLLRAEPLMLMFLTAVSLAVAAIPEALPAVVTIALALGARKMSRLNALIRRLPAVETLGSVTYICADKTGTLTSNEMRLERIVANGQQISGLTEVDNITEPWQLLGRAMALSTDVVIDVAGNVVGDPTETALYHAAKEAEIDKFELVKRYPRIAELPFSAKRRAMTTLHEEDSQITVFCKGAPESVLPRCKDQQYAHGVGNLEREALEKEVDALAAQGYRVLAIAYRHLPRLPTRMESDHIESELTLLGLVGLIDPPRAGVARAVAECKSAGITPVMITGDHPVTACAIAKRLDIIGDSEAVITGVALDRLSDDELRKRASQLRVYARVSPEQKIRIVAALQDNGEFVAMTGDGVNDAPALKHADIGVAMGKKGTDVAREASDMVLMDDNFATIVSAVREGRRIFDNIRKFIKYTMTSNSGEIWTLFLAPFFGLPMPLLPIQILWINLVTDGLPGLALSAEPHEPAIMRRPPRPPRESIFAHGMWQHIMVVGLLIGGLSLAAQAWAYHSGSQNWQTVVFTVLTFCQLAQAMVIRSERESLFVIGVFSNLPLLGAVSLTVILQLMVIYDPILNQIFHTSPLTAIELTVCFALPMGVVIAIEAEKWLRRHRAGEKYPGNA